MAITKIKDSLRRVIGYTDNKRVIASLDFSGQELCIAAAVSNDQEMLDVLFRKKYEPYLKNDKTGELILDTEGNKIKDPRTDLHIQAACAIFDHLNNIPLSKLTEAANEYLPSGIKIRNTGKILNFSIVYGKGVNGFAEDFSVSVDEAQEILNSYFRKFYGLKAWLDKVSSYAKQTRRVRALYGKKGRVIFCGEDNAKGIGGLNTLSRKAGNSIIQATGSEMTKLALLKFKRDKELRDYGVKLLSVVHDELNFEVPCSWKYESIKSYDKDYKDFIIDMDPSVYEIVNRIKQHMLDAEKEILSPLIGKEFPAAADANICPWWKH